MISIIERFIIGFLVSVLVCQIGSAAMIHSETLQRIFTLM
jgi:hypothetical protein